MVSYKLQLVNGFLYDTCGILQQHVDLSEWNVYFLCIGVLRERQGLECDAAIHNKRGTIQSLRSTHWCNYLFIIYLKWWYFAKRVTYHFTIDTKTSAYYTQHIVDAYLLENTAKWKTTFLWKLFWNLSTCVHWKKMVWLIK